MIIIHTYTYIYIKGHVNQKFSVIDGIFLAVTEKSEGRPSFERLYQNGIYCLNFLI